MEKICRKSICKNLPPLSILVTRLKILSLTQNRVKHANKKKIIFCHQTRGFLENLFFYHIIFDAMLNFTIKPVVLALMIYRFIVAFLFEISFITRNHCGPKYQCYPTGLYLLYSLANCKQINRPAYHKSNIVIIPSIPRILTNSCARLFFELTLF